MHENNRHPTFNMKVVVRETGLKPDTLRAWERRYGLPDPSRTAGGHRLYSQHEIDMLNWLIERQKEGLSISRAVDLWRQLVADGEDPVQGNDKPVAPSSISPVIVAGDNLAEMRRAWIDACLAFDETASQQILAQAFAVFSAETVCLELLQQALQTIGDRWYQGSVSVQQEHFASELAIRQLEALLAATRVQPRNGRLLLACPRGEQHTFGLLFLALMLRHRSWDVVYLGANVPTERMEKSARMIQPRLAILAAQTLVTAGWMVPMAHALNNMGIRVGFGGRIFNLVPAIRECIPGYCLGQNLAETPAAIDHLLGHPPKLHQIKEPSLELQETLAHFCEQRPAVEAYLHDYLNAVDLSSDDLASANHEFGDNIIAGLMLGDLDLVSANIDWLRGLLDNFRYPMPQAALTGYLQAYVDAVQARLDHRGYPIVDWLAALIGAQAIP